MRIKINRIRKALVAAVAAGLTTGGAALGAGQDWRAAAGLALGAAVLAGAGAYGVKNVLGVNELRRLLEQAQEARRP